jgi:arylsulfatase A-like enzyme
VDEQIEELLDLLERLGTLDQTIIVFTSDNGSGWGEHGLFFSIKGCAYDECIRVPLLIRYPEKLSPGESGRLTLNIDIAPLLLELAGVPIPGGLDGRPLSRGRGVFRIENFEGLSSDIPTWRGIRTRGHLLVLTETDEFEIYDLARDPYQLHPLPGHGAR